jgi:hypothetical protein
MSNSRRRTLDTQYAELQAASHERSGLARLELSSAAKDLEILQAN